MESQSERLQNDFAVLPLLHKRTNEVEDEAGKRATLIQAVNMAFYPEWTRDKPLNDYCYFTLIFETLSKGCKSFYLKEGIGLSGFFYTDRTERVIDKDVYLIEVKTKT